MLPTRRATAAAWASPLVCEAAALARNVVLARLLGVEEMGKLMLLALVLRLAEMASDLSIERLLAQADDGGSLRLQRELHAVAAARGIVVALLMVAIAVPVASFAGGAVSAASVAALALSPLLRGFAHLDHRRMERAFDYGPTLVVEGGAAAAMLAAAPLAGILVGNHDALVAVVLVQAVALVALSHAVARRRWRVAPVRAAFVRVVRFGSPLLANAALLFLIVQGERLVVTAFYDWAAVGLFAIAAQIALLPALVAGRAAQALLLPLFRRARSDGTLARTARAAHLAYAGLAIVYLAAFGFLAPHAVGLLYGDAFVPGGALVWALGVAAAVRIARSPLSQLAVALGRTDIPARANLHRLAGLAVAVVLAAAGAPLWAIAAAGALGELAACAAAARLTHAEMARRGLADLPARHAALASGATA